MEQRAVRRIGRAFGGKTCTGGRHPRRIINRWFSKKKASKDAGIKRTERRVWAYAGRQGYLFKKKAATIDEN